MSTHRPSFTMERTQDDAMARLHEFFKHNGYQVSAENFVDEMRLERGAPGNGWWSSDMSELHTVLRVHDDGDAVSFSYDIDVRGQHLTQEDRAFWPREIAAARDFVEGGALVDVREQEMARAESRFRTTLKHGFGGALLMAVLCAMLMLALLRLGILT